FLSISSCAGTRSLTVGLLQCVELRERAPEDVDHLVHLAAVESQLRIAVSHCVDRLIFFQTFALEAQALDELFDLGDQDEADVFFTEVALALRAVNGAVFGRLDELENELSFALRTFEDLGQHRSRL